MGPEGMLMWNVFSSCQRLCLHCFSGGSSAGYPEVFSECACPTDFYFILIYELFYLHLCNKSWSARSTVLSPGTTLTINTNKQTNHGKATGQQSKQFTLPFYANWANEFKSNWTGNSQNTWAKVPCDAEVSCQCRPTSLEHIWFNSGVFLVGLGLGTEQMQGQVGNSALAKLRHGFLPIILDVDSHL